MGKIIRIKADDFLSNLDKNVLYYLNKYNIQLDKSVLKKIQKKANMLFVPEDISLTNDEGLLTSIICEDKNLELKCINKKERIFHHLYSSSIQITKSSSGIIDRLVFLFSWSNFLLNKNSINFKLNKKICDYNSAIMACHTRAIYMSLFNSQATEISADGFILKLLAAFNSGNELILDGLRIANAMKNDLNTQYEVFGYSGKMENIIDFDFNEKYVDEPSCFL